MKKAFMKRFLSILWLVPLLVGLLSFAVVYLMDSSIMSLWWLRVHLANCIAMCLLGHCIATICLFLRRHWRNGFISLAMLPFFFFIAFFVALTLGPDIDTVTEKVSAVTAVPQSEIKCLGGNLCRESNLVFKLSKNTQLSKDGADIVDANVILPYLKRTADRLNVPMSKHCTILRFRLEFDTIFVVEDASARLAFFYGMVVM